METGKAAAVQFMNNVSRNAMATNIVCYAPTMIGSSGIWEGANPLDYSVPLFILQTVIVLAVTRLLFIALRPFRQPRVIAEIIGGVLLGPSVLGRISNLGHVIFPPKSFLTLEAVAACSLCYFLFLVGAEMDLAVIRRTGRRALVVAAASTAPSLIIGCAAAFLLPRTAPEPAFSLFLGVALSVTAFPVLARILADTKLLGADLGRVAMSAAAANATLVWSLLAVSVALAEGGGGALLAALWALLAGTALVGFCLYVVGPAMGWAERRAVAEGEVLVGVALAGVMAAGLAADVAGMHAAFGAFVFGLAVPNGAAVVERTEDVVTGLLLPLYFAASGLRIDLGRIRNPAASGLLVLAFLIASAGRIACTALSAVFYSMPWREGVALGFLMNARGFFELVVLNIGKDRQILDDESFAVMVMASVAMTAVVTPVVVALQRPTKRPVGYRRRTIQHADPDAELRVLACVHSTRHVAPVLSLLELAHPTKRSPMFLYALHLLDLPDRLVLHTNSSSAADSVATPVAAAFESYDQRAAGVSVQTLTAVSPYATMHEDICALAADKQAALILLPFHKHRGVDGAMEAANPSARLVNRNVLAAAPCSVAVLVDRGLPAAAHRVALLFFGGPDDREALAFARRAADHPGVSLTVARFLLVARSRDSRSITILTDRDRERQLDEEHLAEFRAKNAGNGAAYVERAVGAGEEAVAAIRAMGGVHDLYVVGRGRREGAAAALLAGMTKWSECPELGPVGDLLVASDFAATVSVLVVQQYGRGERPGPAHNGMAGSLNTGGR